MGQSKIHTFIQNKWKKTSRQTHNYMYNGTTEIQIRTLTDVDLFSQFQWLLYKVANRWQTEVLTEGLNMYQKASIYDRRSQLIIISGSVMLLVSIVSILVVRSNLSIKFYHPTTSLSRNRFVMQGNSWNCTTKYTKWTRCCTGEKWFLLQF
jgi:hypothetical protein